MKDTLKFELEDGSFVYMETEDRISTGSTAVRSRGGSSSSNEQAAGHFKESIDRIKPAAEMVLDTFRAMNAPDEINLEFGIKFSSKVGAIIASADSEATFKVSLKWKSPS